MWEIGGIIGKWIAGFNAGVVIMAYLTVYKKIYQKRKQLTFVKRQKRLKDLHRNTFQKYSG